MIIGKKIKSFIKKLQKLIKYLFIKETSFGAAALTYYTITGIIPLCILCHWIKDFLKSSASVSGVLKFLFPNVEDSVEMANKISEIREQLFSGWWGWAIVLFILWQSGSFVMNIQSNFNAIWKSRERGGIVSSCNIVFVFVVSLLLFSSCFKMIPDTMNWAKYIATFFYIWILVSLAFHILPYDKKPAWRPSILSGALCSASLMFMLLILPFVAGWLFTASSESIGIEILLWTFVFFIGWIIIIVWARYCSYMDKSESFYLSKQVENIAPSYKLYLSILSAAYIFSHPKNQKDLRGLSFDEIRKGMFLCSQEISSDDGNKKAFLPMVLMSSIIEMLLKQNIIQISPEKSEEPRYEPYKDIDPSKYTIGEMLFSMYFSGCYELRYYYMNLKQPLWNDLTRSLISSFSAQTELVCEIKPDILLKKHKISDLDSSWMYKSFKHTFTHDLSVEKLKEDYEQMLEYTSVDELIEHLGDYPESLFEEVSKQEHIEILKKLSSGSQSNDIQQKEKTQRKFDGLFKSLRSMLRKRVTN